jgi:hypothetical protein
VHSKRDITSENYGSASTATRCHVAFSMRGSTNATAECRKCHKPKIATNEEVLDAGSRIKLIFPLWSPWFAVSAV